MACEKCGRDCPDCNGPDAMDVQIATLRNEVIKWRDEANELEDCREALRRLGHVCGCDHVESADERAMQERHIEEAVALLYRRACAAESLIDRIDKVLTVPAAEYVPAIGDVFTLIDEYRKAGVA